VRAPAGAAARPPRLFLERGHPVIAVDIDVSRRDDLRAHPRLEIVQADLEDGSPWPLPGRRFGGVVVTNYLWRPLFAPILDALDDGGVLLYETFARGTEVYGRPTNPDFLLEPGELLEVVRGRLQIVAYEHGYLDQPRPAVSSACARPAPRRPCRSGRGLQPTASRRDRFPRQMPGPGRLTHPRTERPTGRGVDAVAITPRPGTSALWVRTRPDR